VREIAEAGLAGWRVFNIVGFLRRAGIRAFKGA